MEKNLLIFKLSKSQMNSINGGKRFRCTFSDAGTPGWGGAEPGEIIFNDFPESATTQTAENYLQVQLGPEFYIFCEELELTPIPFN